MLRGKNGALMYLCDECGQAHYYIEKGHCDWVAARLEKDRVAEAKRAHTVIERRPRWGDQLTSRERMGERTLAIPRRKGEQIGSLREEA